jgi:putative transposase
MIPPWEKKVVQTALQHLDKTPRELSWYITDTQERYISESSVHRILEIHDLVSSPVYTILSTKEKSPSPTKRVNEL